MPVISHWLSLSEIPSAHPHRYITVPIRTSALYFILQMALTTLLPRRQLLYMPPKVPLSSWITKQPDQNIFGTPKISKKILLKEARNIMFFASHLTKIA